MSAFLSVTRFCLAAAAACLLAANARAQTALRLDTRLGATGSAESPVPGAPALATPLELRMSGEMVTASSREGPKPGAAAPGRVPLIVTVKVNAQDKGEHALYLEGDTVFLVPRDLLREWAPGLGEAASVDIDGVPHVSLASLPTLKSRFDENNLALELELPPQMFATQVIRYSASDRPTPTEADRVSTIVNYQLGVAGPTSGGGSPSVSATLQASLRWREWLFGGSVFESHTGSESTTGRGMTSLTREDPFRLTRFTLGDFTTGVNELAGGLQLGGIAFARALDLDPYTVRQPGASFRTTVDLPSTVDVYVGDTRILRQAVGPGPLQLDNLTYLAGRRDVRVVIRDAFGRERDASFPFYFADRGLAAGVQDYNYGVGALRRDPTGFSGSYGDVVVSGYHRAGLNDVLTLGFQAEGTRDVVQGGPSATIRTDRLGILSATVLGSHDRVRSRSGIAGAIGYTFQGGPFSAGLSLRRATDDFAYVQASADTSPPVDDYLASASWTTGRFGTFTVAARESRPRDRAYTRSASLGYSLAITREWGLQAQVRRTTGPNPLNEGFVTLQYAGRETLARTTYRQDGDRKTATVEYGNFQPVGEGFGYTLGVDASTSPEGSQRTIRPEFSWQSRFATLQGNVVQNSGGPAGNNGLYQLSVSGALAGVGSRWGFSRVIDDSFAIARIEPPVPGVRVYLNQQFMGRTNDDGEVFVPRVVSWISNAISIDDRDVPIERSLDRKSVAVVPWSRSGWLVDFPAPLTRSIAGTMRFTSAGRTRALEYALVVLETPSGKVEVPTARGGDFYFENVPAGDYPASVDIDGRECRFTFHIPDSAETQLRLPDVPTCTLP